FEGHPLTVRAVHVDGDRFNCALSNLRPGKEMSDRTSTQYLVPQIAAAAVEARDLLKAAGLATDVVDSALRGVRPSGWGEVDLCIGELDRAGMKGKRIG